MTKGKTDPPERTERAIYDFFVSYKQRDTHDFATQLAQELRTRGYVVWLDSDEILPGDSIIKSIERGLSDSLVFLFLFSRNYFQGWSDEERRNAHALAKSKNLRVIPIWYDLTFDDVAKLAPLFTDIKAVVVDSAQPEHVKQACDQLGTAIRPGERRQRLFEFFFKCLRKQFPDDPDLKLWVALFANDTEQLKQALEAGADPNLTDTALYNRYAREAINVGCFEEWRRLYLHFAEEGSLASQQKNDAHDEVA